MAAARSRPSASVARQSRIPTELPDYQPPSHQLNLTAQQAIRDLPRSHKLDSLKLRLKAANSHLTNTAAEINDRFQERNAQTERRKARRAAAMRSQESNEEAEREIDDMRVATEEMTEKLDGGVRRVIDAGEEVKVVEEALRKLDANITAGRGVIAQTQSTLGASQFRQQRRRGDGDDEDEDEEMGEGAVAVLKRTIGEHRATYITSTLTDRYAFHNDYVGFKKIVHDAHYPGEEAPPMPHASTWFGEDRGTQSSAHNGPRGTQPEQDDDLVMASERISVKCPITLTEMKDPVSSTKCPHNFERQAFLEMINNSDLRVDGDGRRHAGTKAMRCPVAGCDAVLTSTDVHTDAVMIRKIKRIQAAQRTQNEPDYDEEEEGSSQTQRRRGQPGRHDEEITSSSPPPPQAPRMTAAQFKAERMSQAPKPRQVSMVPNTQDVHMEDEPEDEEEDDNDEE